MLSRVFFLVTLLSLSLATSSFGEPSCPTESDVVKRLSGYEWKYHPSMFKGDSRCLIRTFISLAESERYHEVISTRALIALRSSQDEEVLNFLEHYTSSAPSSLRAQRAMDTLTYNFMQRYPKRVKRVLKNLKQHKDTRVQKQAARTLRQYEAVGSSIE